MSFAIGTLSCSTDMGLEERRSKDSILVAGEGAKEEKREHEHDSEEGKKWLNKEMSEVSLYPTEEEEEEEEEDRKGVKGIDLGPQVSLKDQIEKDKDDESLRRWKEQLLGSVDLNAVGEILEPEVKILSLSIISPERPDIVLPLPMVPNSKGAWFSLKEGSHYRLRFTFSVSNNIVSGLRYTNTVWKTGIKGQLSIQVSKFKVYAILTSSSGVSLSFSKPVHFLPVDRTKEMLGTFSPQLETYTYETPEETTPSGIFARGSYSARTKFIDDDGKCYLEINYTFDIRKEWPQIN